MNQPIQTLSADLYTKHTQHQTDLDLVLQHSWQLIGHISQLSDDHPVIELDLLGQPVLLTRDTDGRIHVLHNVCQHRAGPLQACPGKQIGLRCRYHGWRYDLAGQLISATEMDSTPDFNVSNYRLKPIQHALWHGFVYASVSDQVPALDEYLQGIIDTISPINLSDLEYHHREEYLINCNWKVYLDNYLEGYHIPHIHPELNRMIDYRSYQTVIKPWYSYQFSPLEQVDGLYGNGNAYYITLFPNTLLNIYPSRVQTNAVLPVKEDQCRVIFDYYYRDPNHPKTQQMIEQDIQFSDLVQQEDIEICEQVQRGLSSGAYTSGPLNQKRETGLIHHHQLYRQSLENSL